LIPYNEYQELLADWNSTAAYGLGFGKTSAEPNTAEPTNLYFEGVPVIPHLSKVPFHAAMIMRKIDE
jgi:hypothetical protein